MLEVITGCMYSGKSEELIRRLRRCQIAGQNLIAFKSGLDDRYSKDLATHPVEGVPSTLPAINVQSLAELREHMGNNLGSPLVVGFDEVQFMEPAIIDFLEDEANKGHRVIVAGLDLDSDGKPFGPMAELLARADEARERCGTDLGSGGRIRRSRGWQRSPRRWWCPPLLPPPVAATAGYAGTTPARLPCNCDGSAAAERLDAQCESRTTGDCAAVLC